MPLVLLAAAFLAVRVLWKVTSPDFSPTGRLTVVAMDGRGLPVFVVGPVVHTRESGSNPELSSQR
jgi:hypothetical protein